MNGSTEQGPNGEQNAFPDEDTGADDEFGALLHKCQQAMSEGRHQDAEAISMRIMAIAAESATEEPSRELLLKEEAHRNEAVADWKGAEGAYRQGLAVAVQEGNQWAQFKAHYDISALYSIQDEDELAFQEAQLATEAARRADSTVLLLMALEGLIGRALRLKDITGALAAISESFQILDSAGDSMHDLQRARALIFRAQCRIELEELFSAEEDLDSAWKILKPQFGALLFAGVHGRLAQWWVATARLRMRRNELQGAVLAWREAVDRCRHIATLPQLEGPYKYVSLADRLHGLSQALFVAGETVEAEETLAECQAIRRAIGLTAM